MNDKIKCIKQDLEKNLSKTRYNHSIMVANEAKNLALHYNVDENKAYISGLVHDIAKEFSFEKNKELILKYKLSEELLLPQYKKIIHADIGAVLVKDLYQLDDDISKAVLYHTIGNIKMNTLAKIVFIADKIGREHINPAIKNLQKLAYIDLDKALLFYLQNLQKNLESKGIDLHPNSLSLLKYLNNNFYYSDTPSIGNKSL